MGGIGSIDGSTTQAVNISYIAFHAAGHNSDSIGIEMIHDDYPPPPRDCEYRSRISDLGWPDDQVRQVAFLLALFHVRHAVPIDVRDGVEGTVISHASVSRIGKEDPKGFPWADLDAWFQEELDQELVRVREEQFPEAAAFPVIPTMDYRIES